MNTYNDYDIETLEEIKTQIESLNKFHQLEVLKILSKNMCKLNENKSGVFINISFLPTKILNDLKIYLKYIDEQNETLLTTEYQKEFFKNSFFSEKEDKDNLTLSYSASRQ